MSASHVDPQYVAVLRARSSSHVHPVSDSRIEVVLHKLLNLSQDYSDQNASVAGAIMLLIDDRPSVSSRLG